MTVEEAVAWLTRRGRLEVGVSPGTLANSQDDVLGTMRDPRDAEALVVVINAAAKLGVR